MKEAISGRRRVLRLRRRLALPTLCAALAGAAESPAEPTAASGGLDVGTPMSLSFQSVDVRAALQLVADYAGFNLVVSDAVSGEVTLHLEEVGWNEAIDLILASNGLGRRWGGDVLIVSTAEELAAQDQRALDNERLLTELAPLETAFLRIRYAQASALAALLAAGDGAPALSARGTALVDERTNALIITDTVESLVRARRLVDSLDIPIEQVGIEARIVNANQSFSEQFGLTWSIVEDSADGESEAPAAASLASGNRVSRLRFAASAHLLDLQLDALASAGHAEIVARPRVVTASAHTAIIESGVEIPYQQATESGATSIAFKDAVLQLEVTPRITPDRHIVMELVVKQDTVGRVYHGVPSIDTTRIATQVLIGSGETVALGGIFKTDRQRSSSRLPLLGSAPLLGRLFRRTLERDNKQELFVFLTPTILDDAAAASAADLAAAESLAERGDPGR